MTVRNELLKKKDDLEFHIRAAMQKFMEETGLMITDISASNRYIGGICGTPSEKELDERRKATLMDSLTIVVKL